MTASPLIKPVYDEIFDCLSLDNPRSFFLFAGAGSGKTRTLVEVLKRFQKKHIETLRWRGQRVAIITYTNAACDEIIRRLDYDSTFWISTIHSFSWELIKPYQQDIREWLRVNLQEEIAELEEAQRKGRPGKKASEDRPRQIAAKKSRLEALDVIKRFTYNPNGENVGRDSLNHTEVISLTVDFLVKKTLMQKILVQQFPILLIDESQDTKHELIDAFFLVQSTHHNRFALGLFGDTMQRIYSDGKTDLGNNIPHSWAKPALTINYRCPKRIIRLINRVRNEVDGQTQEAAKVDEEGIVRLFIANTSREIDKNSYEGRVAEQMARITGDKEWLNPSEGLKVLTLEHLMAARRGGFKEFFEPLYKVDKLKTGLLDGSLPGINFFANQVLPLILAKKQEDGLAVSRVVRKNSSYLRKDRLRYTETPRAELSKASKAVSNLWSLWQDGADPLLCDILKEIFQSGLFPIPEGLNPIAQRLLDGNHVYEQGLEASSDMNHVIDAWDKALRASFRQFENYFKYISDQSRFGTHQGIKGLEFPRVMVILDDEEARGFMFSYDKLFGVKEPTQADSQNASEGKETSINRTRRLFYVTCSRAEKSLAIIAYTKEPEKVRNHVLSHQWFEEEEVVSDIVPDEMES